MSEGLVVEFTSFGLLLVGYCDAATAPRLDGALRRWQHGHGRCEIDLSLITFADTHGLAPLAEGVRRSRQLRRPELRMQAPSRAVQRVLEVLRVSSEPFGLHAWDAAVAPTASLTRP